MQLPTAEQVEHAIEIFAAGALCVGAVGTAVETLGEKLGDKLGGPVLVKVGQALEDFAANIPRLLGKEKPRS
jgi:Ca2+/H+ antiporter